MPEQSAGRRDLPSVVPFNVGISCFGIFYFVVQTLLLAASGAQYMKWLKGMSPWSF
jgi:hypothetical protein